MNDNFTFEHVENPTRNPLLTEGEGNFTIKQVEKKTSRSGNSMLKLTLEVYDSDGNSTSVFDYLVGTQGMAWKTKHLCEAVGKPEWYGNDGSFNIRGLIDLSGKCVIKTEKEKVVNGEKYDARSKVDDYIKDGESLTSPVSDELDDDLPF